MMVTPDNFQRGNETVEFLLLMIQCAIGTCALMESVDVRYVLFWAMMGLMPAIKGVALFLDAVIFGGSKRITAIATIFQLGQENWRFLLFGSVVLAAPFIYIFPIVYAFNLYKEASSGGDYQESRYASERSSLVARASQSQ